MVVPLTFWHDDNASALRAAKAAGKGKGCEYKEWDFPEGRGFAILKDGAVIEKHLIRSKD